MPNVVYPLVRHLSLTHAVSHCHSVCPLLSHRLAPPPAPPPQPLSTTEGLTASVILPFPECYAVGTTEHVAFLDWLLLPNSVHLKSLHFFSWLDSVFLPIADTPLFGCSTVCIYSAAEARLLVASSFWQFCQHSFGGFCVWMYVFNSLGKYLGTSPILNHLKANVRKNTGPYAFKN